MNLILGGISILIGFAGGNLCAANVSVELRHLNELYVALETLENHILCYSSGISEAIQNSSIDKKCVLFKNIAQNINSSENIFEDAVNKSPYNTEIKSYLIRLFDAIEHYDENDINKSFDITLSIINKYRNEFQTKNDKNAPLYRKIGILSGIGIAVLLL